MTPYVQNMTWECRHAACDNGKHGDLSNGLQLMPCSIHLLTSVLQVLDRANRKVNAFLHSFYISFVAKMHAKTLHAFFSKFLQKITSWEAAQMHSFIRVIFDNICSDMEKHTSLFIANWKKFMSYRLI